MINFASLKFWWWIAGILAISFGALGAAYIVRGASLKETKVDLQLAVADLNSAKRTIAGQQAVLKECSDRTDALKADGDRRRSEADQELARLRKLAERYQASDRRLALLTAGPTPAGAKCEQAVAAIRRELRK